MDFFQHQDAARRNTKRLVVLFGLAVVLIVVAVNIAARLIFLGAATRLELDSPEGWLHPQLALAVTVATLGLILVGSLYKTASLREGGAAVARMMGGRPVDPNSESAAERRLLNVVEEMAIAAGAPVPDVYVLDQETAINAFAAGLTPADAVVAVSAGCLENLSRDELQGVVAHEFSHIVNGDMRINLRLIGLLHGILVIALIGYWVLYSMRYSGMGRRSSRKEGGAQIAILLFAVALLAIGGVGMLFGRLIKSGVSRQREFLADSAGVQFTRNPSGLAGALKKIGGLVEGSRLQSRNVEQASHLLFANGLREGFFGMLATHPPLRERIRRLDPGWNGELPRLEPAPAGGAEPVAAPAVRAPATAGVRHLSGSAEQGARHTFGPREQGAPRTFGGAVAGASHTSGGREGTARILDSVGHHSAAHLAYSRELVASLPAVLRDGATEPSTSRCIVFGLLLDRSAVARQRQLAELARIVDPATFRQTLVLAPRVDAVPITGRLPLIDLTLLALRRLSPSQYDTFAAAIDRLIEADDEVSLFELTLRRILHRNLAPVFDRRVERPGHGLGRGRLAGEGSVLLSALAHAGEAGAEGAFAAGAAILAPGLRLLPPNETDPTAIEASLNALALASPAQKRRILEAAITVVVADRAVTVDEGELLRAIADALGCPVPPLLPGRDLD